MRISRREWMLAAACWSELRAAQQTSTHANSALFSAAEASELRALTNAILPETDTPGAEQAGAVRFISAALAGYDRDQRELYGAGLRHLAAKCRELVPQSRGSFAGLTGAQKATALKSIEHTEFFEKLRIHTVLAYFGNPQFGWKLLGRDPAMHFEPPFGFYDAEASRQ